MAQAGERLPEGYEAGRFTARPRRSAANAQPFPPGEHAAASGAGWDGVLLVPASYDHARPAPFMLALHGATGTGERMIGRWRETAEAFGVVVLCPSSETRTWDVLIGGYGSDVARIDRALHEVFSRVHVDPAHCLIEGFSDGASYALGLGLANGDLFTHILANSPGFCWPPSLVGQPRVLITHGAQDQVLPIGATSRMLAPQLQFNGYDVTYQEFDGGHQLTPEIMALSLRWAGLREPG